MNTDSSTGFYSYFFLVDKKDEGIRPILDLCTLNTYISKVLHGFIGFGYVIIKVKWFIVIDFKDAYFHISIQP